MPSDKGNGSRALWARGLIVLGAVLGLGLSARPAEAAPFAYVVVDNFDLGTLRFSSAVSVIDTATNKVVGIPIQLQGASSQSIAVTPDGKHVYAASAGFGFVVPSVCVIDTATNTVVATVTLLDFAAVGGAGVAVTPDGKHVYVTGFSTVSVIDTATNTVVATVPVGNFPDGVAVTPDGKHAYAVNNSSNNVSVIDTATNTVVATVTVGTQPFGVAITPDGKNAYVANSVDNTVSVIATATNSVVATIALPQEAVFSSAAVIGIVPPPPGVPFLTFNALLAIQFGGTPNQDAFAIGTNFTLSSTAPAINPHTEPVTLQVGTFTTTIPIGSFVKQKDGSFAFKGVIGGVNLEALIKQTGTLRYAFQAKATGANLTGTTNTVYATLTIGGDSGATSVTAQISP